MQRYRAKFKNIDGMGPLRVRRTLDKGVPMGRLGRDS